jgi:hypothetical protein
MKALLLFSLFLASGPYWRQTSQQGAPAAVSSTTVKSSGKCPGFSLDVSFDAEGRPADVRVTRTPAGEGPAAPEVLSEQIVDCLIDQLTPSDVRGGEKPLQGSVFCSGLCIVTREYGKVTITETWPSGVSMRPCPSLHYEWR